jgi:hypothetical protein
MALALESSSLVQRRAELFTSSQAGKGTLAQRAFATFFKDWAANHGNADLQLVRFLGTGAEGASGEDEGIDAAHRVYAIYGKKTATAEDVYLYFFDDATNDAGAGTDGRGQLVFLEASTEAFAFYPSGIPMVDGLVVKAYTDFDGVVDTTSGAAPNGFVIIGAP